MKITLTGSLGHIGKPLAQALVQQGHAVTVISSNPEKQKEIEALGATAAIGIIEDVGFLANTFKGADVVYTMLASHAGGFMDHSIDLSAHIRHVGNNYAQAISEAGVKRVVHLSSIGAHLSAGTGLILDHRAVEEILGELPDVAITFMRPTAFHYNLYGFLPVIKHTGAISSNYGGDDKIVWVAPADIAVAVADEINLPLTGTKVRYVACDELTCNEVARILGAAIGMPDLQWLTISAEQMQTRLEGIGMNPKIAAGLVEMQSCMHSGEFFDDYYQNRPAAMGKVKMTDFAKEFAAAFNQ